MHKKKNILLIIAAVIVVGCLLYIPNMQNLGLYRDDWNNLYSATIYGPDQLLEHYRADRPADGYLLSMLYRLFRVNLNAYRIWNLCCRILGSVFFALTLLKIWPRTPKMAGLAGVLAVAFPGFLRQVDGISYIPHQTAMMLFMLSMWLTALACEPGQKKWNVLYTFLSLLCSFAYMMLMEYYVGMEIFRLGMIYLMNREQAGDGKFKSSFKCLLSYIPYLIPVCGFVAWRVFFFDADRSGADLLTDQIKPLLTAPRDEGFRLLVRIIKSIWKLFAGVWTVPAYNAINPLDKKAFLYALIPSLIILAASQLFLFLVHRKKTDESIADASNESAQWLWYGLICGSVSILPLVIAGRDINFSTSLDRFAWPGMIGSILFLIGLLGSLRNRVLRNLLTMAAILLSVFVQWQNVQDYAGYWAFEKDFMQQLLWRAPMLEKGTTILEGSDLLAEEDYDIFSPVAMAYFPVNQHWGPEDVGFPEDVDVTAMHWTPIGAEVLNYKTVRDVILETRVQRETRKIFVDKNYNSLLAISKPSESACLRVIDGENPVYSSTDWTLIPKVGDRSKLSQIIADPEQPAALPFYLGQEQEHTWCYYYEKMELALQQNNVEGAAKLADEALEKGFTAGDAVEWIPVIRAYAQTGRMDDALTAVQTLEDADEVMGRNACSYFLSADPDGTYAAVIDELCDLMDSSALPAAVETVEENELIDETGTDRTDEALSELTEDPTNDSLSMSDTAAIFNESKSDSEQTVTPEPESDREQSSEPTTMPESEPTAEPETEETAEKELTNVQ